MEQFGNSPITEVMTTTTTKKRPGPRTMGKITVAIRMFPDTKRALNKAAARRRERSISDYAEEAIITRLKEDGFLA